MSLRQWRNIFAAAFAVTVAQGQSVEYKHQYTFGSKLGIHPTKSANRRFGAVVAGDDEHPYGLAFPTAVTTDAQQRVWIADRATASVHIFDVATHGYQEIRKAGNVILQQPAGLATDRAGRIYLTDSTVGNVFVFEKTGEFDRMLMPRHATRVLERPTAIAVSENSRTVYVADPGRHAVIAFNQEGESVGTIGMPGELNEPTSISVVGDDIYVLDTGLQRVQVFSASGRLRRSLRWPDVAVPTAFAYDATQHRFFVGDPRWMVVQAFSDSEPMHGLGTFGQLGDGVDQTQRIEVLYVDAQGLVYVVDSHHGKVLVYAAQELGRSALSR